MFANYSLQILTKDRVPFPSSNRPRVRQKFTLRNNNTIVIAPSVDDMGFVNISECIEKANLTDPISIVEIVLFFIQFPVTPA
jgi:hypothetical protein